MRYRDLISPPTLAVSKTPDNIVLLHVCRGDMKRLQTIILTMDVSLYGPFRRIPAEGSFVEVACKDEATAAALKRIWHIPIGEN